MSGYFFGPHMIKCIRNPCNLNNSHSIPKATFYCIPEQRQLLLGNNRKAILGNGTFYSDHGSFKLRTAVMKHTLLRQDTCKDAEVTCVANVIRCFGNENNEYHPITSHALKNDLAWTSILSLHVNWIISLPVVNVLISKHSECSHVACYIISMFNYTTLLKFLKRVIVYS